MFVRPVWRPRSDQELYELINANPWALLVTNGPNAPFATNLPLICERSRGTHGVLVSHIALANEHAEVLRTTASPTLAIFSGPASYVTSSWYPKRDMPPTYYYTTVHCYGRVTLQAEPALHESIEELTARSERNIPNGWHTNEIKPTAVVRRLKAVVGFELHVERIEGKFKLGQDEPRSAALAVADRLAEQPERSSISLSALVRAYNEPRADRTDGDKE